MLWALTEELCQNREVEVFRMRQNLFPSGKNVTGRALGQEGGFSAQLHEALQLPSLRTIQRSIGGGPVTAFGAGKALRSRCNSCIGENPVPR